MSEHHCKPVEGRDLESWISQNPLPVLCEQDLDGLRVFLFKSGEKIVLSAKNGAVFTPEGNPTVFAKIPELTHCPHRAILDGEYVSRDNLYLYDVIQVDNRDLTNLPLEKRKEILNEILHGTGLEMQSNLVSSLVEVEELRREVVAKGGEGIIVKNPLSAYNSPGSWLRLSREDTIDCFITKVIAEGAGQAWQIAVYDERKEEVVNLGQLRSMVEKIDPGRLALGSVVRVRFRSVERSEDGGFTLLEPFIVRIRHDKLSSECLCSQPAFARVDWPPEEKVIRT